MNEWSPGGSYSRPGTPNQTGRSFRNQWDESDKGSKPLIVNIRALSDNRSRSFQQYSMEDVSKTSLSSCSKNNKSGSGVSDPRFKRVLSPGALNDACVGTEVKSSRLSTTTSEKGEPKTKFPAWMTVPDFIPNQPWGDSAENTGTTKPSPTECEPPESENVIASEPSNFDQTQDHLKAVDKLSFSHDIIMKSFSKESLSGCTVNTRNTSLASEDLGDDISNELSVFPTATRVKKVQNWIQDQKVKPEKKQSVITVIGQTQEQENLSSALREIDKRRKLVKELDKYAICKKIIDTDKEKEISDLVLKINCLSKTEKDFIEKKSSDSKETCQSFKIKDCGDDKNFELLENDKNETLSSNSNNANPNIVSSTSLHRKRSSAKRKSKKYHSISDYPIKGKVKEFFSRVPYQWVFCIMVLLSGILFWFTFFTVQRGTYVSFDLFSAKPKPLTWYEKIFTWLWEFFRPTSNYRRAGPWHHSY